MRVLIVNPIPYTSETRYIERAESIQDTMIYDLCLAFQERGHEVTLYAAEPYKPRCEEAYPFEVRWGKCVGLKVFHPHRFPVMPELYRYLLENRDQLDLIITSEVFSMNSLIACRMAPDKTIIWHELAKHNAMMKRIPSRVWYGFVARQFMYNARIVARSEEAKAFVGQFCPRVEDRVIDHGVNLSKFRKSTEKTDSFVVCSQLIGRKRIDGIIRSFVAYREACDGQCVLYIIGDGEKAHELKALAEQKGAADGIVFTGRLDHDMLMPILAGAQALLVNTEKDNNMISIVESIAVGTPVVTTDVPLNAAYIREFRLGIAKPCWDERDLQEIVRNNKEYVENCLAYRERLSTAYRVEQFIQLIK